MGRNRRAFYFLLVYTLSREFLIFKIGFFEKLRFLGNL